MEMLVKCLCEVGAGCRNQGFCLKIIVYAKRTVYSVLSVVILEFRDDGEVFSGESYRSLS